MFWRPFACAAVAAVAASGFTSCNHTDIYADNSGTDNSGTDHKEIFTKAFINEFGLFKAKPWDEAETKAVTVRTARPTEVNIFADIDGQRFLFASLGSVDGRQSVMVNVPSDVNELIVRADGMEYTVKPGGEVDLTKNASRYAITPEYVTDIPSLNGFDIVRMPDEYREIGFTGSQLKNTWLRYGEEAPGFNIFNADHNFTNGANNNMYMSSMIYGSEKDELTDFTIYPLYWRENVYGESDYLLGIYYFDERIYDLNADRTIRMIDLDDFDLKNAISFKKAGTDSYVVSQQKEAYDPKSLNKNDSGHFKGYHMKMKNVKPEGMSIHSRVGFYIKSGLKPGSSPEKGRDYTHITFMNCAFNGYEWGDGNYWETKLKDIRHSYCGAAFSSSSPVTYAKDKPERVDGKAATYDAIGTNDAVYNIIGFMSQPDGPNTAAPDFSDVVIALTYRSMTVGREIPKEGETFGIYPWYLASEDLGSTDDWDFNDLVVTIYDLTTDLTRPYVAKSGEYPVPTIMGRRITVVPRAVGGTLPIYLMYEGEVSEAPTDDTFLSAINAKFEKGTFVVGTEMHEWLGEPDYTQMLNTGKNNGYDGCAISFCIPLGGPELADFDFNNIPQDIGIANQAIRRFWVLVDKDDNMRATLSNPDFDRTPLQPEYKTGDMTQVRRHLAQNKNVLKPFDGKLGKGAYRVDPPKEDNGDVPQMIMCQYSWIWPTERTNIADAYTSFRDWVAGKRTRWHGNPAPGEGTNGYIPELLCPAPSVHWMQ